MTTPKLGDKAKDKITGIEGYIDSIHHYLHGCTRYAIAPLKVKDDGSLVSHQLFDEPRIEVLPGNVLETIAPPNPASPPGGPRDDPGRADIG